MSFFGEQSDTHHDPEVEVVGMSTQLPDEDCGEPRKPEQLTSRHVHTGHGCYRYIPPVID